MGILRKARVRQGGAWRSPYLVTWRTSRARTPAGLDSLGNAYNKCPVTPVREETVATWLSRETDRDSELGTGMSSTTDLKRKVFRRLLTSITGTDLSLSMEREITLWSPS